MVEAGNSIVSNNINLSHCTVFHKEISMLSHVVQVPTCFGSTWKMLQVSNKASV